MSDSRQSVPPPAGIIDVMAPTSTPVWQDTERCYRAVTARDQRFDGQFIMAVRTTGIYCRPSCPALTPKAQNVRFFPTSAAAQAGGYRACRRCLPDAVPGSPDWNVRADLAARAMRLISDGLVEREGVPGLARRLGYSERQLGRVLTTELGAGPLALARAHRAHSARLLIEMSQLSLTDVAFAAGFSSVRQFNETIREVFATTPSQLRAASLRRGRHDEPSSATRLCLRLPFRAPFDAQSVLRYHASRALPGIEATEGGTTLTGYGRTLRLPHGPGSVWVHPQPDHVRCDLALTDLRDLGSAVARVRRLLDLDADPEAVARTLAADKALAPLISASPGVRVPGAVDGPEVLLRTLLGNAAADVATLGEPISPATPATEPAGSPAPAATPLTGPPPAPNRADDPASATSPARDSVPAAGPARRPTPTASPAGDPSSTAGPPGLPTPTAHPASDPTPATGPAGEPVLATGSARGPIPPGTTTRGPAPTTQLTGAPTPAARPAPVGGPAPADAPASNPAPTTSLESDPVPAAGPAGDPTPATGSARGPIPPGTLTSRPTPTTQLTGAPTPAAETARGPVPPDATVSKPAPVAGAPTGRFPVRRRAASADREPSRSDGSPMDALTRLFPTPATVAEADVDPLVRRVAAALAEGTLDPHVGRDPDELRDELLTGGVSPAAADYVVMRLLGAPDVLLSADPAVRQGAGTLGIDLATSARGWQPWSSYAGMYLRTLASHTV
ncbi:hypothetical protein GCM10022222_65140 [Amycolatopsis ultiminotia]|uniref:HTH araC/xylS-type domain-containing protein n=1 Tax=Amycolatopsis ultiminotia TaxID=543629 RepID=A0ABP6XSU8_9PSEU